MCMYVCTCVNGYFFLFLPSLHVKWATDPTAVYHVFCLFKMGHEVVDTTDIVEVDRTTSDIVFDGTIHL